ncbi:hypothetical protein EDD17DRAFT_214102 [Pisolithus thermaeus]|nr:hypothetical protein EDD17DRAFT_214102 [Pisolithus thermaeus]
MSLDIITYFDFRSDFFGFFLWTRVACSSVIIHVGTVVGRALRLESGSRENVARSSALSFAVVFRLLHYSSISLACAWNLSEDCKLAQQWIRHCSLPVITLTAVMALIPAVSGAKSYFRLWSVRVMRYTMMNNVPSLFFEPRAVSVETLRRGGDDIFWSEVITHLSETSEDAYSWCTGALSLTMFGLI